MGCIQEFLQKAREDQPVYISLVRRAFAMEKDACPLFCRFTLYDGSRRDFTLYLPETGTGEETGFLRSYLHAELYNMLSVLGARQLDLYPERACQSLEATTQALHQVFQVDAPKSGRSGYGKCLNVNDRVLAALSGGRDSFRFVLHAPGVLPEPLPPQVAAAVRPPVFAKIPALTAGKLLLGMDIGGTDIKVVAAVDGQLCLFKEYDWFPAAFGEAEQLLSPIHLLTRLLRAAASLCAMGMPQNIPEDALERSASLEVMEQATLRMEALAGPELRDFDAIGLCFPDVVIRQRIVGGETYKTRGMRNNPAIDYEQEFAKITSLHEQLAVYTRPGGAVMITNDGPMAAFTTAVEQAGAGVNLEHGFFAHTLGTELGTGWVLPDGAIPEIPLEAYNFIIDLGSFKQRVFEPDDVRSVLNFNTGLPGTLQKYGSQSGVFRLAAKQLPVKDPALYAELLARGFFLWQGDKLLVPTGPEDLRKPCLEFLMQKAADDPSGACADILRQLGESLAVTWLETEHILSPACKERTLYGRLVKNAACFELLLEGARRLVPGIQLSNADEELARTPLMRQLRENPRHTIAQFAQAVGAVYYGCLGLMEAR